MLIILINFNESTKFFKIFKYAMRNKDLLRLESIIARIRKMTKFRIIIQDIVFVSRLTNVSKKKLRIFLSVLLANLTVLFDILVILVFAFLLGDSNSEVNSFIKFFIDNLFLLPVLVIFRFLFIYIERVNIQSLQLKVEENLRSHLMKEIFDKNNYSVADAYFYVNELSRNVSYFYGSITSSINYFVQIVVYTAYLLFTSFNVVVYFFIGAVLLFFPTRYFLVKGRGYIHEAYENEHKTLENIQKVLENIYLIKILSTTAREIENFEGTLRKYYSSVLNNFKFGAINNITPNFVTVLLMAVLFAFFDFVKFITLEFIGVMLRLFQTLGNFNNTLNMVINSHVHLEKLNQLEKNKVRKSENVILYHPEDQSDIAVSLKGVSFKYFGSSSYIFDKLDLEIERNKHTLIVGDNGSGKSTLLGLISGILIPEQGSIKVSTLKYAYVGATPLIIKGTLRENLLYGNGERVNDDSIMDLISSYRLLNNNTDLNLDENISNKSLSSGQMQKVSFIRAMLSKPEILILDESTSNLDIESKNIIKHHLKNSELTIINSTHNADEVEYDNKFYIEVNEDSRNIRLSD